MWRRAVALTWLLLGPGLYMVISPASGMIHKLKLTRAPSFYDASVVTLSPVDADSAVMCAIRCRKSSCLTLVYDSAHQHPCRFASKGALPDPFTTVTTDGTERILSQMAAPAGFMQGPGYKAYVLDTSDTNLVNKASADATCQSLSAKSLEPRDTASFAFIMLLHSISYMLSPVKSVHTNFQVDTSSHDPRLLKASGSTFMVPYEWWQAPPTPHFFGGPECSSIVAPEGKLQVSSCDALYHLGCEMFLPDFFMLGDSHGP